MASGPIILPQPAQLLSEDDLVFTASKHLFLTNGLECYPILVRYRWMVKVNQSFPQGELLEQEPAPLGNGDRVVPSASCSFEVRNSSYLPVGGGR